MPTFIHGKDTKLYINEFDFSDSVTSAETTFTNEPVESTSYGDASKKYVTGLQSTTLSVSGFWAGGSNEIDEELFAFLGNGTSQVITAKLGTSAIGGRAIIMQADEMSYGISNPVSDLVSVSADFTANTKATTDLTLAAQAGVQLTLGASIAHGSLGSLSSVDNSASSANGGFGILHVPTNTVNGNTTIKIQHSANDASWADLASFTAVGSSATTSELKAVSGTVNRYLRATASTAGSSGSITFMVAFARF